MTRNGKNKLYIIILYISINPAINPRGIDPTSPKKILEGGLLNEQNANEIVKRIKLKQIKVSSISPITARKLVKIDKELI